MRDYHDAKVMAQSLRTALTERNISIKQSESLEIVAQTLGVKDWNTLSALIRDHPTRGPQRIIVHGTRAKRLKARVTLPAIPLLDVSIFPRTFFPLLSRRKRSLRAIETAVKQDGRVFLIAQKDETEEEPDLTGLYGTGVVALIHQCLVTRDDTRLTVEGLQRARIERFASGELYEATIVPVGEQIGNPERTLRVAQQLEREYQAYASRHRPSHPLPSNCEADPGHLADEIPIRLMVRLKISPKERQQILQQILEEADVPERLSKVAELLAQAQSAE